MSETISGLLIVPTEISGHLDPTSFGVFNESQSIYYGEIKHGSLRDGEVWARPADASVGVPDARSAAVYLRSLADEIPILRSRAIGSHATKNVSLLQSLTTAYAERDQLVALLSKLFPSHLVIANDAEPGFTHVVIIDLPTGQVSWHIADHELEWFGHLQVTENDWDGHSTPEKWTRVMAVSASERESS